jgi:hypothetical protein
LRKSASSRCCSIGSSLSDQGGPGRMSASRCYQQSGENIRLWRCGGLFLRPLGIASRCYQQQGETVSRQLGAAAPKASGQGAPFGCCQGRPASHTSAAN